MTAWIPLKTKSVEVTTNMPLTHKDVLHIVSSKKAIPYQFSVGILAVGGIVGEMIENEEQRGL
jgi:hypothetical protein